MNAFQYTSLACTCLAGVAIGSSFIVIGKAVANPVNAVLWLIVAFVAVACYLITVGMPFLGLSYIIVYVGAIAVLFLFVVMMLNLASHSTLDTLTAVNKMTPIAFLIGITGGLVLLPLAGHIALQAEVHFGLLNLFNSVLYGSSESTYSSLTLSEVNKVIGAVATGTETGWYSSPAIGLVSPMTQVQVLGLTLYTNGALVLFLLSFLLMLAMIVPLALAFTS